MSPQIIAVDELGAESDFLCGRAGIKLWEQSAWHDPCREYERTVGKTVSETVDGAKTFSAVYISGKRSRQEGRKMQVYDEHMERITC